MAFVVAALRPLRHGARGRRATSPARGRVRSRKMATLEWDLAKVARGRIAALVGQLHHVKSSTCPDGDEFGGLFMSKIQGVATEPNVTSRTRVAVIAAALSTPRPPATGLGGCEVVGAAVGG